jgi:hypothetical protein
MANQQSWLARLLLYRGQEVIAMRIHGSLTLAAFLLVTGAFLESAVAMGAEDEAGIGLRNGTKDHPFEGERYQTMRALAHSLDERAQHAASQSIEAAHKGMKDERKFVDAITQFADQARDFHRRMDNYQKDPWDVPDEVEHLNDDAHKVSDRIRQARVFEQTWKDWDGVLDVLQQMNRVIAGYDVEPTF